MRIEFSWLGVGFLKFDISWLGVGLLKPANSIFSLMATLACASEKAFLLVEAALCSLSTCCPSDFAPSGHVSRRNRGMPAPASTANSKQELEVLNMKYKYKLMVLEARQTLQTLSS